MQGRLSDLVNGEIQAFPKDEWRNEFKEANSIDLNLMEWTLDYDDIYKNPLMTINGRKEIKNLCKQYSLDIFSLTGDCFMQQPFWKSSDMELKKLKKIFKDVLKSSSQIGLKYIVIPLVDNGKIENIQQENLLRGFLLDEQEYIKKLNLSLLFETDLPPLELKIFINKFPCDLFGINYDTGNSAALGYEPSFEINVYGEYIKNVHIKDRVLNGNTIELGKGNADFQTIFESLSDISYKGNFILQTARAEKNQHKKTLEIYKKMTEGFINKYFNVK